MIWSAAATKSGEPIPVPLNDDAIGVLERWRAKHDEAGDLWSPEVHRHVCVYRRRAPIQKVTTAMWRRECKAVGLEKVTFHSMRHAWASWQTQAGTPLRMLQELGGWANLQMPSATLASTPATSRSTRIARTLLGPDSRKESVKVGETC